MAYKLIWALLASGVLISSVDSSITQKAAENIERLRKGNATIEFRLPDGSKLGNAKVEVKQTSHDFPFGNYIRPRHYNNRQYLDRFKELFNFIELLEFNWGQYEPDEGKPLLDQRMNFIRNWCIPNGFNHFYGQYDVKVHFQNRIQTFALHLEKDRLNKWSFTLK